MGQTLTHGVYLPDEGERNCYNGLAANWQLLDNSVGTIAEHTTALAGKAPAVHTHTKSDITDFPAYGTTAGTICEGNDSRLSDARTPVAHTHLTSDVTDLLSGSHTWTGDNTYSKTVTIERNTDTGNFLALKNSVAELGSTPASAAPTTIAYRDKNNDNLGYMGVYYDTDGSNHFRLYVRNKFTSGAPSTSGSYDYAFFGLRLNADKSKEGIIRATFRPYDNNTHDLGSSSYQWNNVYSKGYYYNGTPWGLDKLNRWSQSQELRLAALDDYTLPSSEVTTDIFSWWGTNNFRGGFGHQYYTNGDEGCRFLLSSIDANNADHLSAFRFKLNRAGTDSYFYGTGAQNFHLGTSTNKWKTLNGINPGALSLPQVATNFEDLTGYVLDGVTENRFPISGVMALDGWLQCRVKHTLGTASFLRMEMSYRVWTAQDKDCVSEYTLWVPVKADTSFDKVICLADDLKIRFHPCLGNV